MSHFFPGCLVTGTGAFSLPGVDGTLEEIEASPSEVLETRCMRCDAPETRCIVSDALTYDQDRTNNIKSMYDRQREWLKPGNGSLYWRDVLKFAKKNNLGIAELSKHVIEHEQRRKITNYRRGNNQIKPFIHSIFLARGSTTMFRQALALELKTGNIESVMDLIRKRLNIPGLGESIVPGSRKIRDELQRVTSNSFAILNPEPTYTGIY